MGVGLPTVASGSRLLRLAALSGAFLLACAASATRAALLTRKATMGHAPRPAAAPAATPPPPGTRAAPDLQEELFFTGPAAQPDAGNSSSVAVDPLAQYYAADQHISDDLFLALGPSALLIVAQDGHDAAFPWAGVG